MTLNFHWALGTLGGSLGNTVLGEELVCQNAHWLTGGEQAASGGIGHMFWKTLYREITSVWSQVTSD